MSPPSGYDFFVGFFLIGLFLTSTLLIAVLLLLPSAASICMLAILKSSHAGCATKLTVRFSTLTAAYIRLVDGRCAFIFSGDLWSCMLFIVCLVALGFCSCEVCFKDKIIGSWTCCFDKGFLTKLLISLIGVKTWVAITGLTFSTDFKFAYCLSWFFYNFFSVRNFKLSS